MEKKEELTLKELAAYLPYGLKCQYGAVDDPEYGIMNGLDNYMGCDEAQFKFLKCGLSLVKPILRPLSDLIPVEDGEIDDYVLIQLVDSADQPCDAYDEWRDSYFDNPDPSRILQAPYEVFQELLKQHYDVFNLIPAGLAIDINSLTPSPELKTL